LRSIVIRSKTDLQNPPLIVSDPRIGFDPASNLLVRVNSSVQSATSLVKSRAVKHEKLMRRIVWPAGSVLRKPESDSETRRETPGHLNRESHG
jgi:hypothetical protein